MEKLNRVKVVKCINQNISFSLCHLLLRGDIHLHPCFDDGRSDI